MLCSGGGAESSAGIASAKKLRRAAHLIYGERVSAAARLICIQVCSALIKPFGKAGRIWFAIPRNERVLELMRAGELLSEREYPRPEGSAAACVAGNLAPPTHKSQIEPVSIHHRRVERALSLSHLLCVVLHDTNKTRFLRHSLRGKKIEWCAFFLAFKTWRFSMLHTTTDRY